MVIEGAARGRPAELAAHLLRTDHNESVNVLDIWGTGAPDLASALQEMHAIGAGARSRRTLYHANIDPRKDEQLTAVQKKIAVERLGRQLGFEGQPFVVVEHVKNGRPHLHAVWSRIDLATMTAIHDGHNYRRHEEVARELEREFGHENTPRVHTRDKDREARPRPAPSFAEYQQLERSGMTPQQAKAVVTECWNQTETGPAFREKLETSGFILARGDRREFILVDSSGEIHGLARRVDKVKAAEIRDRLAGVDTGRLPDATEARRRLRQARPAQEQTAGQGFTSAVERLRTEEVKTETRKRTGAGLRGADREIADAVWQLNKTMRGQMEATVSGVPGTGHLSGRTVLQEPVQHSDTYAAPGVPKSVPYAAPEPPAAPIEPAPMEAGRGTSLWRRAVDWVRDRGQGQSTANHDREGTDLPGVSREAIQQPSSEAEKSFRDRKRPSMQLFVKIFGVLVDAYQQALDRAIAERDKPQPEQRPRGETLHEAAVKRLDSMTPARKAAARLREDERRRELDGSSNGNEPR